MIKNYAALSVFLVFFGLNELVAQDVKPELINVMPASPNASSLAKFGQVPVSYFTGLPEISVSLFDVSSGKLKLPVNLSYHASGVRVEELAPWVGLGWALGTGGVITREIHGTEDEGNNGYFNPVFSAKILGGYSNVADPNSAENMYLTLAGKGGADTEADIFHFNAGNISGKFVYNQEDRTFYTIPRQNIKIEAVNNGRTAFKITIPSGDVYNFSVLETTTVTPACFPASRSSKTNTTAWYLSDIISADKKDTISFNYDSHLYSYESLGSELRNFVLNPLEIYLSPPIRDSYCTQTILIRERLLRSISFRNGSIGFNTTSYDRCDLLGSQALDNVELKNVTGSVLRKWQFSYSYFGSNVTSSNCTDYAQSLNIRLRLDSLKEISSFKEGLQAKRPYIFQYNTSAFPNRMSKAQDYWGFYNGKASNATLIPSYVIDNGTVPILYAGGDREVDPAFSGLGNIEKVKYPTGGTTSYVFENNRIVDSTLSTKRYFRQVLLDTSAGPPMRPRFEKQFTINEPPNPLNGMNPLGGAFITLHFGDAGCDIDPKQGATTCAQFILQGISDPTLSSGILLSDVTTYYPNGTYKLTASFNQSPANFQNFYFTAVWAYQDTTLKTERYTGGLRLKKIIDFDGVNHQNDIIRNFKYTRENDSLRSSGSITGFPLVNSFMQKNYLDRYYLPGSSVDYIDRRLTKISSYSNQALTQTAGAYTTYNFVTVTNGNNSETGKTTYKFLQIQDVLSNVYPYVSYSNDWRRGQLLEQVDYRKNNGIFLPVKRVLSTYSENLILPKFSTGLKTYYQKQTNGPEFPFYDIPDFNEYSIESNWIGLTKQITRTYNSDDTTKSVISVKDLTYSPVHLALISEKNTRSNAGAEITSYKYPQDYEGITSSNKLSSAVKYLQDNNVLSTPIEIVHQKVDVSGNVLTSSAQFNSFKNNNSVLDTIWLAQSVGSGDFYPSSVSNGSVIKSQLYYPKVSYDQYDNYNNLVQQSLINGAKTSYKWDYNHEFPVAEVKNAAVNEFFYEGFENDGVTGNAHTGLRYHSGSYPLNFTIPSAKPYKYSYWSLQGDKWVYSGEIDYVQGTTLNGVIDDVTIYPWNAHMTTYTYQPLEGMTSQTIAGGNTSFYEYDTFQRLLNIRDQNRYIVKNFNYHYADKGSDTQVPYVYLSAAITRTYTKNNCAAGGIPGTYTYTVPEGIYSSTISQDDADAKALSLANANGQALANSNGGCTFKNVVLTQVFTKNDCASGGIAGTYSYTIPAGTYTSTINQDDAQSQAQNAMNANGQAIANANASCTFRNTVIIQNFTKNDCSTGGYPEVYTYTLPAGSYISTISQADAQVQAQNAVNANGQAMANANAGCTFYNTARSQSFTRGNCKIGGVPGTYTYTVAASTYTSRISLEDANSQAQNNINLNGQAAANANAACTYSNNELSQTFTRNNCGTGGTPGTYTFVIPAGTYTSTVGKQDAIDQAQQVMDALGQNMANQNAGCTFRNTIISQVFTKNNCSAGGYPDNYTYAIPAGSYISTISQEDAQAQAQNAINVNGQTVANASAGCTFSNTVLSQTFTRSNCKPGGIPGTYTYTVAAGTHSSRISIEDANSQAQNNINLNGQNAANANGSCTFSNNELSQTFTRNNCGSGGIPGTYTFVIPAGTYTSTVGKQDAIDQAQQVMDALGQNMANQNAGCSFRNAATSQVFKSNLCVGAEVPSNYTYVIPEGKYVSTVSLDDANAQARADLTGNGQAMANSNGTCDCVGAMNRRINGVCETGNKVITKSVYNAQGHYYTCTYHYEWSNGTKNGDFVEQSSTQCALNQ